MAQFNTNGIYRIYGAKGTENISVGTFNGNASLTHFNKQVQGGPAASMPLSPGVIIAIIDAIQVALNNGPGTATPIIKNKWDDEQKKMIPLCSIIVGMDEGKMLYLSIKSSKMSEPFVGYFKEPKSITYGHAESDEDRSKLSARGFKSVLEQCLPVIIGLSRDAESMKKQMSSYNGRGGGSYNNNNSGGNTGGGNSASNDSIPF